MNRSVLSILIIPLVATFCSFFGDGGVFSAPGVIFCLPFRDPHFLNRAGIG
jgi:hypothetical protein